MKVRVPTQLRVSMSKELIPLYAKSINMLDGLSDDQVNQYLEEHPKIVPLFEVDIAEAVTLYVVVKFPAHSEKPEDVRRIGGVQRVHSPLYKCCIEVRGIAPQDRAVI